MNFKYFNYGIKEFNAPSWLVRTPHRYRRGQRSNLDKPGFFQAFFFRNCIICDFNCDDLHI